jgi:hypothetical protein
VSKMIQRASDTLNSSNSIVVRATARSSVFVAQKSSCARPGGACGGTLLACTFYNVSVVKNGREGRGEEGWKGDGDGSKEGGKR